MAIAQSNMNPAIHLAAVATFRHHHRRRLLQFRHCFVSPSITSFRRLSHVSTRVRAISTNQAQPADVDKLPNKPPICTADELHYVTVKNSDWRLALWLYGPSPQILLGYAEIVIEIGVLQLVLGIADCCLHLPVMCGQGFDTWVLEVRGAGLSTQGSDFEDVQKSAYALSEQMEAAAESMTNATPVQSKTSHAISEQMETAAENTNGALPASQKSTSVQSCSEKSENSVVNEELNGLATAWDECRLVTELTQTFTRLSERLSGFLSESQSKIMQTSGVASQIRDLSQKLVDIIDEAQRSVSPQLFDLSERLTKTLQDLEKLLDLIVKYDWDFDHHLEEDVPAAMEYIRAQSKQKDGRILAIGHSLGGILLYAMLARYCSEGRDPGLAAVVTLASSLDYTSSKSSLKLLIPLADPCSAQDMMHPELLKKLILNNFSLAGDRGLICPPEAVYETVKTIPEHLSTYKVFGEPNGPHYAHYDLVGGRLISSRKQTSHFAGTIISSSWKSLVLVVPWAKLTSVLVRFPSIALHRHLTRRRGLRYAVSSQEILNV
ncbi:hypothetical protein SASPL_133190 [Salvia splendens]|uniref:Uncharacterized protein n=1 Tax=Salvia splendens TaxID=180675 RepID=A0A8X8ZIW1_SALSN|nr:hypothetical protein SASPL_133190 [Salvia splendens]